MKKNHHKQILSYDDFFQPPASSDLDSLSHAVRCFTPSKINIESIPSIPHLRNAKTYQRSSNPRCTSMPIIPSSNLSKILKDLPTLPNTEPISNSKSISTSNRRSIDITGRLPIKRNSAVPEGVYLPMLESSGNSVSSGEMDCFPTTPNSSDLNLSTRDIPASKRVQTKKVPPKLTPNAAVPPESSNKGLYRSIADTVSKRISDKRFFSTPVFSTATKASLMKDLPPVVIKESNPKPALKTSKSATKPVRKPVRKPPASKSTNPKNTPKMIDQTTRSISKTPNVNVKKEVSPIPIAWKASYLADDYSIPIPFPETSISPVDNENTRIPMRSPRRRNIDDVLKKQKHTHIHKNSPDKLQYSGSILRDQREKIVVIDKGIPPPIPIHTVNVEPPPKTDAAYLEARYGQTFINPNFKKRISENKTREMEVSQYTRASAITPPLPQPKTRSIDILKRHLSGELKPSPVLYPTTKSHEKRYSSYNENYGDSRRGSAVLVPTYTGTARGGRKSRSGTDTDDSTIDDEFPHLRVINNYF